MVMIRGKGWGSRLGWVVMVMAVGASAPVAARAAPRRAPAAATAAPAQPPDAEDGAPASFGSAGQFVPSGGASFNLNASEGRNTIWWGFALSPSLLYFVTDGLAVGGSVRLAFQGGGISDMFGLGAVGRVGYNFPLGTTSLSIMPSGSVGLGFAHNWGAFSPSVTNGSFSTGVEVELLYHPVAHFFFGAGPYLALNVNFGQQGSWMFNSGLQVSVGGWL